MSIVYSITSTKLTPNTTTTIFDIKTKSTKFRKDIDFNSAGLLQRLVGLDKLIQQTEKAILVKKNTYNTAKSLGTILTNNKNDTALLTNAIRESLATYAKLQQQQVTTNITNIIGTNVYRTADINDPDSWQKINDYIVSGNTYSDIDLPVGATYYYAITKVYTDTTNNIKETPINSSLSLLVKSSNTMQAKVNSSFVIISKSKKAVLYWKSNVVLDKEEQLRSIINVRASKFPNDPRGLRIEVSVTNRNLDSASINTLRG